MRTSWVTELQKTAMITGASFWCSSVSVGCWNAPWTRASSPGMSLIDSSPFARARQPAGPRIWARQVWAFVQISARKARRCRLYDLISSLERRRTRDSLTVPARSGASSTALLVGRAARHVGR